jgi:hypothetical protein
MGPAQFTPCTEKPQINSSLEVFSGYYLKAFDEAITGRQCGRLLT